MNNMLHKLQHEDYDKVYEIMEKSFPKTERRNYEDQVALLENPLYQIYVLQDEKGADIQGFMATWDFEKIVFLEHFAVNPDYRNGGLGSVMLKELADILSKPICLEVELPDTELAIRRIGFYERNGFCFNDYPYMQPALSEECEAIPLRIMTLNNPVEEGEFLEIVELLYTEVYHQEYVKDGETTKYSNG